MQTINKADAKKFSKIENDIEKLSKSEPSEKQASRLRHRLLEKEAFMRKHPEFR